MALLKQGFAMCFPWETWRYPSPEETRTRQGTGNLCKAKSELSLLHTKGLRRGSVISLPFHTPNSSFSLV